MSNKVLKVEVDSLYNAAKDGTFIAAPIIPKVRDDDSIHCREEFYSEHLEYHDSFFFQVSNVAQVKEVFNFINYFQNLCKISEKNKAVLIKTSHKKVIGIRLGKYWSANWARKDLFTALLRASLCEGKSNAEKIKNCEYIDGGDSILRKALDRFISGYRNIDKKAKYDGADYHDFGGWMDTFSDEESLKLLKR